MIQTTKTKRNEHVVLDCADNKILIFSLNEKKTIHHFDKGSVIVSMCTTPDKKYLLLLDIDSVFKQIDMRTKKLIRSCKMFDLCLNKAIVTHDGQFLITSINRTMKFIKWSFNTQERLHSWGDEIGVSISELACTSDDKFLVYGTITGSFEVYDLQKDEIVFTKKMKGINLISIDKKNKTVYLVNNHTLIIFNLENFSQLEIDLDLGTSYLQQLFEGLSGESSEDNSSDHSDSFNLICKKIIQTDKNLLIVVNEFILQYDLELREITKWHKFKIYIYSMALNDKDMVVAVGYRGDIYIIDPKTLEVISTEKIEISLYKSILI